MFNLSYLYLIFTYLCPHGRFCMKGEIFWLVINFYETWIPLQSWHIKINISTQNRSKALTPKPCILWIQDSHMQLTFFSPTKKSRWDRLQIANIVARGCVTWVLGLSGSQPLKAHGIASRGSWAWVFALSTWIYKLWGPRWVGGKRLLIWAHLHHMIGVKVFELWMILWTKLTSIKKWLTWSQGDPRAALWSHIFWSWTRCGEHILFHYPSNCVVEGRVAPEGSIARL